MKDIENKYRKKLFDYFVISFNHLFKYPEWWHQEKSLSHLASCYAMLEEHIDAAQKTEFYVQVHERFINTEDRKAVFLALIQSAKEKLSIQPASNP
jgi:hypothetical protein